MTSEKRIQMQNDMTIMLLEIDRLNKECEKLIEEISSMKDELLEINKESHEESGEPEE